MANEAPERIYADRGPRGGLLYRELRMPDTIAEYVRADLATISSDAVAGGEPVSWRTYCGGYSHTSRPEIAAEWGKSAEPLYAAPPETAQLQERVKELEKAADEAYELISKLEYYAVNDIMYDGREVEAWCARHASCRVREGGKVE